MICSTAAATTSKLFVMKLKTDDIKKNNNNEMSEGGKLNFVIAIFICNENKRRYDQYTICTPGELLRPLWVFVCFRGGVFNEFFVYIVSFEIF